MMTPERWSQIKDIFVAVVDRSAEERQSALNEACQGDLELQAELRQLLAQHDEMGQFLDGAVSASASGLLNPGYVLAERYEIVALLGSGGMGEVYEAEDKELGGRIALKVIHPQMSVDPAALDRFRREAQLSRQVTHPNVCRIFDIGRHEQQGREIVFLTMELIKGETLAARLKRVGKIGGEEALNIAVQLCQALGAAHQVGILHRDFKCGNVMLIGSGENVRAVVTDFGIARWMRGNQDSTALTNQGVIFGTPAYMSPEQIQGKELTPASDIYSLGLVLYEMVTGVRPFQDESPWAEGLKRLAETPVSPGKLVTGLDSKWNTTILHCLKCDPGERFSSTKNVLTALRMERRTGFPRRHRRLFAFVLVAGILAIALFAIAFRNSIFAPRLPTFKRIAVLRFHIIEDNAVNRARADGLSEFLTQDLDHLRPFNDGLSVARWSDVKSRQPDEIVHAASDLGVSLLLTGQIEKNANKIRLHVEVKDAVTFKNLSQATIEMPEASTATLEEYLLKKVCSMLELNSAHYLPVAVGPGFDEYATGRGYLSNGGLHNTEQAIEQFKIAIEKDRSSASAYASLSYAYSLESRMLEDPKWHNEAIVAANKAIELNDKLAITHLAEGAIKQDSGDLDGAIWEFKRAKELDPDDDTVRNLLAIAYEKAGQIYEAGELLKAEVERRPQDWFNHNDLGWFYYRHGKLNEAVQCFLNAINRSPNNPGPWNNLAGVYLALRKFEESETASLKAIAIYPNNSAYSNLGALYQSQRNYSRAVAMFQEAVKLQPDDDESWGNLGDVLIQDGKPPEALVAYQRAAKSAQNLFKSNGDVELLAKLAFYHVMLGQQETAKREIEKAAISSASSASLYFYSARVYELTGYRSRALDQIRLAIRYGQALVEIENAPDLKQLIADKRYTTILQNTH